MADRFQHDPGSVSRFLDAFVGRAYGLESGLSHKAEFGRNSYDAVVHIVDPVEVIAALTKVFGEKLDGITFDQCHTLTGDEQTAGFFVAIHDVVLKEKVMAPPPAPPGTGSTDHD